MNVESVFTRLLLSNAPRHKPRVLSSPVVGKTTADKEMAMC